MAFESSVSQVVIGPDTVIQLRWRDTSGGGIPTFAARNFGIEEATLCEFTSDWQVNDVGGHGLGEWGIYRSEIGDGIVVSIELSGGVWYLAIGTTGSWAQKGSFIDSTTVAGLAAATFWRMHVKAEVKEDDSTTVTATVRDLSDNDLGTLTATVNVPRGPYCGFHATFPQLGGSSTLDIKNIRVQASGSTGFVPNLTSTAYVYTFVNNRGWESVPSLPTANILRPDGVQVTVTTSTTAPVGYSAVTLKRIYRLVQAQTGDLFLLVSEIPLAQADFVDNLADNEVGPDELESQNFDLPPGGLRGIMALPSGAYSGFVGKELCISAAGWPHAWPLQQRHSCEFNIVATSKVGNTIVVGTAGRAYTCTGTEPSSYVMSEPGESQACVSKRSMVFMDGQGVAFASPDGYQLCAGSAGNLRNLTENVFTKRQWRDKNPSSIIAAVHDGVLHWYWETEETEEEVFSIRFENFSAEQPLDLSFQVTWPTAMPLTAAAFASWNSGTGKVEISQAGIYEITFSAQFDSATIESYESCLGAGPYGASSSKYPNSSGISAHHREASSQAPSHEQIVDTWLMNVVATDSFFPMVYGKAAASTPGYFSTLTVTVKRLGASLV